ncbi:class I SAM-dependent methyltransferase [Pseudonocardia parietis]|uniref:O-methyltransferase involved in polyketide biosynthesis n=1 Tax=Pseudonocardia parietis TaxID=570936 RepID=A0ABS4W455_9PSEU|nr:class I SAM-dependent methyltransferase [Pseudonocardia parietis]MBP2370930.1 O-methyltransferase involved in polyketide biosynthesis [Pseudonocardia parietis]
MTGTEKVILRGAAATLLMTLYLRSQDARSSRPILDDPYAVEVYDRIEHDVHGLWQFTGDRALVACRAAILDDWIRDFLAAEPDGQVLHLGCGLDSRPLRVGVPTSCRWLDVDLPEVMAIRRRLYEFPEQVVQVSGSVPDDGWWTAVDPARPTLTVAEGLFMYLPPQDVHTVVDRIVGGTPRAVLAFDAVADWIVTASGWTPVFRALGTGFRSGWEPAQFAHRHPTLRELDDISVYDEAAIRESRLWLRPLLSAVGHLPALQDAMRLHRFVTG